MSQLHRMPLSFTLNRSVGSKKKKQLAGKPLKEEENITTYEIYVKQNFIHLSLTLILFTYSVKHFQFTFFSLHWQGEKRKAKFHTMERYLLKLIVTIYILLYINIFFFCYEHKMLLNCPYSLLFAYGISRDFFFATAAIVYVKTYLFILACSILVMAFNDYIAWGDFFFPLFLVK